MAFDEGVELRIIAAEQHADIAAAGSRGFVDEAVRHRCIRQLVVASIEYAEIMVNTEAAQNVDVLEVLPENPAGLTRGPGVAHA